MIHQSLIVLQLDHHHQVRIIDFKLFHVFKLMGLSLLFFSIFSEATSTTPYTPSGGQKRFNPFLKDIINVEDKTIVSPLAAVTTKKPLTPTKKHPLQDLTEEYKTDSSDDGNKHLNDRDNDNDDDIEIEVDVNENKRNNIIQLNERQQHEFDDNQNTQSDDSTTLNNKKYSDYEHDSSNEGSGIVKTNLPPGKVVRRKKTSSTTTTTGSANANKLSSAQQQQRSSYPQIKDPKLIQKLEAQMGNMAGNETDSSERLEDENRDESYHNTKNEQPVPEWVVVGESVQIRPYNISGVISFVGPTHFQVR